MTLVTLARYGLTWPLLVTRETLRGYDDVLAFWINLVLGDDWAVGGRED